jgi:cysteinyl-tRNA synthetase
MNLYDQIMNLCHATQLYRSSIVDRRSYAEGHRDARHAAAELAKEANVVIDVASMHANIQAKQISEQHELIEQLAEALAQSVEYIKEYQQADNARATLFSARAALKAVQEYRDG